MRTLVTNIYHHRGLEIRFLFIGGINTIIGILFFPCIYYLLPFMHNHYLILMILSQFFCITFSYLTNKCFVFRTKEKNFVEYLRFTLFYNIVFAVNLLILPFLVSRYHFNPAKIQLLINIFIAITSYFWHKHISFQALNKKYTF